ncbi:MAG: hypothetical protein V9H69_26155 [Anaerolineae bacterium]|jgi:uncharacterized protein YdiU (UPF0061 family)
MTPQQQLRYQLALLLVYHGQKTVLAALGELLKLRAEDLHTLLAELDEFEPKVAAKRKNTGKRDKIESIIAQQPDKSEMLRELYNRFNDRTFLAELRDVRRFLENHSEPAHSLKSRSEALPKLMNVLARLDISELRDLCRRPDSKDYSALGIISDQILGRDSQ